MKKLIIVTIAILGSFALYAQEDGLKKQVEVTKDYMPDIERAAKLSLAPKMTDTVTLRPEINYSIRPVAWLGAFGIRAISPIKISSASYRPIKPFYVKVGGGYPLNSLLDFYATNIDNANGTIGGYVNHVGQYADIMSDASYKTNALQTNNSIGVFGNKQFGRLILDGELGYQYDVYSRYGKLPMADVYAPDDLPMIENREHSTMQSYATPHIRVRFGNSFTDLSRFNFRLGAALYHMSDRFDFAETGVNAFIELGKMFSIHNIYLKAEIENYKGAKNLDYYANTIFKVAPRYKIQTDRFKISLGGDFVVDKQKDVDANMWFFPDFKMTFDLTSGYFVPFIDVNGRLANNGYRNTALINPYIVAGLTMPNTAEYNGRAGISGSFSSAFSYRAYAGVSIYKKMNFLANLYVSENTAEFVLPSALTDNVTMFTVGVEADGRISGSFTLNAAAHYYGYSLKNLDKAAGRPNFDAQLGGRYSYRDKFSVSLWGEFLGSRHFYGCMPTYGVEPMLPINKVDPVVNLNLDMDLKVSEMVGIFVQGRNLTASKLYPFNHYQSVGVSCAAGVKLLF